MSSHDKSLEQESEDQVDSFIKQFCGCKKEDGTFSFSLQQRLKIQRLTESQDVSTNSPNPKITERSVEISAEKEEEEEEEESTFEEEESWSDHQFDNPYLQNMPKFDIQYPQPNTYFAWDKEHNGNSDEYSQDEDEVDKNSSDNDAHSSSDLNLCVSRLTIRGSSQRGNGPFSQNGYFSGRRRSGSTKNSTIRPLSFDSDELKYILQKKPKK